MNWTRLRARTIDFLGRHNYVAAASLYGTIKAAAFVIGKFSDWHGLETIVDISAPVAGGLYAIQKEHRRSKNHIVQNYLLTLGVAAVIGAGAASSISNSRYESEVLQKTQSQIRNGCYNLHTTPGEAGAVAGLAAGILGIYLRRKFP